jgi:ABC-2 type transport system permease protein
MSNFRGFGQLFLTQLRILYRNPGALFFIVLIPAGTYIALVTLPIGRLMGHQNNFASFVLPGVICFTIMQTGIYGLAYLLIDFKARGVMKRFMVTPIRSYDFVLTMMMGRLAVNLIQAGILAVLGYFYGVRIAGSGWLAVVFVLLTSLMFMLIGLLVARFNKTYESASAMVSGILLPFTALGGIFYSVTDLPHWLAWLASILPITFVVSGLRAVYLGGVASSSIYADLLGAAVWVGILLVLALWLFRLEE